MEILQRMPFLAQDAVFKKLSEIAEVAALSKDDRLKYDESLKHYRDTIAVMQGQYLEGMEKGMEKGLQQGEQNMAMTIARKMKAKGMPIEAIAEMTGLTVEEIAQL